MNILALLSGGVDSSGALFKYVKENPTYNFHILHYINASMKNAVPQRISVYRNLNLLRSYFPNTSFTFIMPFVFFDRTIYGTECFDIFFYRFFSSVISHRSKITFDYVINGATKTDNILKNTNCKSLGDNYEDNEERWNVGRGIWNALKMHREHINTEILRPCVDMTKEEIIDFMPDEYSLNTFTCQSPSRNGKMMYSYCLNCHSCDELLEIGAIGSNKINQHMLLNDSEFELIKKEFTFHDH